MIFDNFQLEMDFITSLGSNIVQVNKAIKNSAGIYIIYCILLTKIQSQKSLTTLISTAL